MAKEDTPPQATLAPPKVTELKEEASGGGSEGVGGDRVSMVRTISENIREERE